MDIVLCNELNGWTNHNIFLTDTNKTIWFRTLKLRLSMLNILTFFSNIYRHDTCTNKFRIVGNVRFWTKCFLADIWTRQINWILWAIQYNTFWTLHHSFRTSRDIICIKLKLQTGGSWDDGWYWRCWYVQRTTNLCCSNLKRKTRTTSKRIEIKWLAKTKKLFYIFYVKP